MRKPGAVGGGTWEGLSLRCLWNNLADVQPAVRRAIGGSGRLQGCERAGQPAGERGAQGTKVEGAVTVTWSPGPGAAEEEEPRRGLRRAMGPSGSRRAQCPGPDR